MLNKICIVLQDLNSGGAQKILHKYALYESLNNTDVTIVLLHNCDRIELSSNIKYIYLNKSRIIFSLYDLYQFFKVNNFNHVISTLKHISIIVEIIKIIGQFNFKHISRVANVYSKELETSAFLNRFIFKFLILFTHRSINKFICVSECVANDLYKFNLGVKSKTIYNPIDSLKIDSLLFETSEDCQTDFEYFIFIGRLSFQKNLFFLIDSYNAFLKTASINYKLIVIGDGPDLISLKQYVLNLNLEEQVVFLGFRENPYKYLAKSKLLLLTSFFEGLPNVLIEALYLNVPIVSINCDYGPSEIITSSRIGELVNEFDVEVFASAINKVLNNYNNYQANEYDKRRFQLDAVFKDYHNFIFSNE
jgi:glycosyltransferase involved in cell wall biosynthesis